MCQRTLLKHPTLFWRSFWGSKGLFPKSPLCRVWGDAPTDNAHEKTRRNPRFLFYQDMLELRSKTCFKRLFVKSPLKIRKNFPSTTPLYFGEAFEVSRDFSRKVLCVRVWGDAPTDNARKKHGIAVLFLSAYF